MEKVNINEKFGDWFLDLSKYVATAMILTSLFADLQEPWLVVVSTLILCVSIFAAIYFYKQQNKKSNSKKNKK
ncbi:MAG: hypothetical protein MJZ08_00050 [Bacteroidaceae bacterium]|nr:hypothetical protein [Bacteroidaceae bacterium]